MITAAPKNPGPYLRFHEQTWPNILFQNLRKQTYLKLFSKTNEKMVQELLRTIRKSASGCYSQTKETSIIISHILRKILPRPNHRFYIIYIKSFRVICFHLWEIMFLQVKGFKQFFLIKDKLNFFLVFLKIHLYHLKTKQSVNII